MQKDSNSSFIHFEGQELGSVQFRPLNPSRFDTLFADDYSSLSMFERHTRASQVIFDTVLASSGQGFLFRDVIGCISVIRKKIAKTYCFSSFELWLNHYCSASKEDQGIVRAKIVGKSLNRSDYQQFFPIGLGNTFFGSHFTIAHFSPDLDTTIASLWGFMDAFGARVSDGLHYWQVPGGRPKGVVELDLLFDRIFSRDLFDVVAKSSRGPELTSLDFLSARGIRRSNLSDLSSSIDYDFKKTALVVTDEKGHYVGDWRSKDANAIRNLVMRLLSLVSAYEHSCSLFLIQKLAKGQLKDLEKGCQEFLSRPLNDCSQGADLTPKMQERLEKLIVHFLGIDAGLGVCYGEFLERVDLKRAKELLALMQNCHRELETDGASFAFLEKLSLVQGEFFNDFKASLDTLESGLKIKKAVFGIGAKALSHVASLDEVKTGINDYHHVSVAYEGEGLETRTPLGVIWSEDLKKKALASVSLRDFSNFDEMQCPDYMQVISCVDHHKSKFSTAQVSRSVVSDSQSSNAIIASMVFELNDRVSCGAMTIDSVEESLKKVFAMSDSALKFRIQRRLLQRKENLLKKHDKFVSYDREFIEYYHFLYAIFDDTDLLNKVTAFDLRTIASLLNRMKSLSLKDEVEVVNFDDIEGDENFLKLAQRRLLENKDLYSLYVANDEQKKTFLEKQIIECVNKKGMTFFSDTKIQNKYACIGQFKMMRQIEPLFREKRSSIQEIFVERSETIYRENSSVNLFMFMLSSIDSAQEVYQGSTNASNYKDELWFYTPSAEKKGMNNLALFLSSFLGSSKMVNQKYEVECIGPDAQKYSALIKKLGCSASIMSSSASFSLLVLKIACKSIRSRKSDISVHLN